MKGNIEGSSCPLTSTQDIDHELDLDLLCWGSGELGRSECGRSEGIAPEEAHRREFTQTRLGTVKLLACGSSHSIVVTVDNKIFAWGNGTSGQLGDGQREVKDHPVEVKLPQEVKVKGSDMDVDNIVGVACGSRHSFIWTQTGQAYSFGNNFYAQLGYDFQRADFKEHQLAPHLFQSLPSSLKISQVACGERHTLFALEDGSVAACGHNDYGQIGSGSNESVVIPRFVECVGHVSKVTCGANHNLVLTGEGKLFQWGCGRACGNAKKNILSPEEVPLPPSSPVREISGGCWHSMLLTDGGNVFSWGMGQEGQLGLGEDRNHVSSPCLLSYSRLAKVTQIRAGDNYGAAVTAGGELFLWGQVPCLSVDSDRPGLKKLRTPQPVLLGGRKVCDVACGTWHMMALATGIRETNRERDHPEYEAVFRDLISNPLLTEHAEKENTVKDLEHRSQVVERQAGTEEQQNNDKSYFAHKEEEEEEEGGGSQERPNNDEGDGVLHDSAFTLSRSEMGMDRRVNDHSSIKSNTVKEGGVCRSAGQLELRKEPARRDRPGRDVVFTTLHLLPRSAGEQCRPMSSTLPRLRTGREAQNERSTYLTELVQKSGSDSSISQSPKFRLKPRPPGRCTCPGAQRGASCHYSRTRLHAGLESPIYNSSPHLNPGHRLQASRPPSRSSSEPFRYGCDSSCDTFLE